ncbi:MAG: DUF4214 domain-containing protein [Lachnospiraceae bacterium]|nr:DUF4214 domain-containing protein [Lachnospiraceae bacterium]
MGKMQNEGYTREMVLNGFTGSPEFIDDCLHAGIDVGSEI